MQWIFWVVLVVNILHYNNAEEDSTYQTPYQNSQGGSRLYPTLNGVTDYNKNGHSNIPGQYNTGYNNMNTGGYPNQGNYNSQTGAYNMSYAGYPASGNYPKNNFPNAHYNNGANYNLSYPNYPNSGNRFPTQQNTHTGIHTTNPHNSFSNSKDPHRPFGSPGSTQNRPGQTNTNYPNTNYPVNPTSSYPSNINNNRPNYPNYPNNSGYPKNPNNPSYPYNPNFPNNPMNPSNSNYYNNTGFPNNPSYPNNQRYPTQNQGIRDPHRPFGQAPTRHV